MNSSDSLSASDMRRTIRLATELHDFRGNCGTRDRLLFNGLLELTDARCGFVGLLETHPSKFTLLADAYVQEPPYLTRQALDEYFRELTPENLLLSRTRDGLKPNMKSPVTRMRAQVVEDGEWLDSSYVTRIRRPLELGDSIASVSWAGRDTMSVVVIDRAANDPGFSAIHCRMTQLLHSEIGWMFDTGEASPRLAITGKSAFLLPVAS